MSVVGYSPTPITLFEEYTWTGTWTDTVLTALIVKYTRINNLCTVIFSGGMSGYQTNTYSQASAVPSRFRPTRRVCFPIMVQANNVTSFCYAFINTDGLIWAPVSSGDFSNRVGLNAGNGTFWTIDFPSVSYVVS